MRKPIFKITCLLTAIMLLGGCGKEENDTNEQPESVEIETETEHTTELEEMYVPAEEDSYVPTIEEVFAEEAPYQQLADFLILHYQIPEEYQAETRYYYNYIDLNSDGLMEIFAVVFGEYTKQDAGDPAVILSVSQTGEFVVLESFDSVRTPITISDQTTNGWSDIVYYTYGGEGEDGYRICRYDPEGGYQTELSEIVEEVEPMSGMQILSNNLIDDMDQGRYLTLAAQTDNSTE